MLTLPAWRLLVQFPVQDGFQLYSWVKNWVVVETRKLFYEYGPSETRKTWELATMAVLEIRRAMLAASNDPQNTPSTFTDVIRGLNVHHNVDKTILESASFSTPASNSYRNLPLSTETCVDPCFYYSNIENEKGIEGVFRSGFEFQTNKEKVSIFFQRKMYKSATPKEILEWLLKADGRTKELGYKDGSYAVQLFVTGAVEDNIEKYLSAWPDNCMVFATEVLQSLYEPFGNGFISEIVKMNSRTRSK
jgi:hypothetical protein